MRKRRPKIDEDQLSAGAIIEQSKGTESPCEAAAIAEDNLIANPQYYKDYCKTSKHSACKLLAGSAIVKTKARLRRKKATTS